MTVEIRLEGSDALKAALRNMSAEMQAEVSKAVVGTAIELRTDVVKRIQSGPPQGWMYYRIPGGKYMTVRQGSPDGRPVAFIPGPGSHNLSYSHRASAPGQPPMSDTGRLANSVTFDTDGPLTATVGSALIYARWLEYGTRKIKPRPAWVPAVEDMRPKYLSRLEKAIARATK